MVTLEKRLEDPDYKSWVKAALCVHLVKEGLETFADIKSQELHHNVLSQFPTVHTICPAACTDPLKKIKTCCFNCRAYLTSLESNLLGTFTFRKDQYNNTEVGDWHTQPWQMAKLFMNRGQAKASIRASETDLSGILNFLGHCSVPWNDVQNQANIDEVRKKRNEILHTSNMLLSETDFLSKTQPMLDLLNDPKVLAGIPAAQIAANEINKVRRNDFKINLDDETTAIKELADEIRTLNADLTTKMNELERNYIGLTVNCRKDKDDQQVEIRRLKDGMDEVKRLSEEMTRLYNTLQAGHIKDSQHLQNLLEKHEIKVDDDLKDLHLRISDLEDLDSRVVSLEAGVRENKLQINELREEICNTQSDDPDADQVNDHEIPISVDEGDDVELALHLVRLIKWYPWLKSEMTLADARMIARAWPNKESVREVLLEGRRRIAIDNLLKHVLRTETKIRFFNLLDKLWKPSDEIQELLGQLTPTEEDIEVYRHVKILDARQWHFQEDERKELRFTIKELTTLDTLNNWFLAKFFYSHIEHDVVIEKLLHVQDLGAGVDCLFDTMYKCDRKIVRCFCDTLESYCYDRSKVVTRLDLRQKYCDPPLEVKGDDTFLGALKCKVVRFIIGSLKGLLQYFEQLEFNIDRTEEGSLVVYLSANTESAWKNLTHKCRSGEIVELLNTLDIDDQIWKTYFEKDGSIRMTIYSVKVKSARPKAVLRLELRSQDQSVCDGLGTNPIKHSMDILCEELEICDSLIDELKKQELVRDDIRELLERQHTRASEIRCLMENISPPEKGFKALLDYAKRCNTYLFDQLEISSEEYQNTKLFFTCEAKPTPHPAESDLARLQWVSKGQQFYDSEHEERSDVHGELSYPGSYEVIPESNLNQVPVIKDIDTKHTIRQPEKISRNKKQDKLVVMAIDFGTTYTGYAYSFCEDSRQIYTNYWEGSQIKAPTIALLDDKRNFHSFGNEAKQKYIELIKKGLHKEWYYFEYFKMKLFVQEGLLDTSLEMNDMTNKTMKAIDIFAAAIKYMKEHFLEKVHGDHKTILKAEDVHFILTVPAMWSDLSKRFMRQAAIQAGIPDEALSLVLEPEVASLYCKENLEDIKLPPGTRYIVADLGGGTADFTCHEVNLDNTLKELQKPSGAEYGGITVDHAFRKILNAIFGTDILKLLKERYMEDFYELFACFDLKKRNFQGRDNMILQFPVSLLEIYEKEVGMTVENTLRYSPYRGRVEFKSDKMIIQLELAKRIFNEAISKIVKKTTDLLEEVDNLKALVLVGGFSESNFLRNTMMENFDGRSVSKNTIRVLWPEEPASAVIIGAVITATKSNRFSSLQVHL